MPAIAPWVNKLIHNLRRNSHRLDLLLNFAGFAEFLFKKYLPVRSLCCIVSCSALKSVLCWWLCGDW